MSSERKALKILSFINAAIAVAAVICGIYTLVTAELAALVIAIAVLLIAGGVVTFLCAGAGIRGGNTPRTAGGLRPWGAGQAVIGAGDVGLGVLVQDGAPEWVAIICGALMLVFALAALVYAHKVLEQALR